MGIICLSAQQNIIIHGIWSMKRTLDWETVKERGLTVSFLSKKACLTEDDFFILQSDASQWVQNNLCCIQDCKALSRLPLNPVSGLKVTVDKLFGFSCSDLLLFGVKYDEMKDAGMTPVMMNLFHFSLSEWMDLGFSVLHLQTLTSVETNSLFGMDKQETIQFMDGGGGVKSV